VDIKDVEDLLERRRKNPGRFLGLLLVMAIVSILTIVSAGFLDEFGKDLYSGFRRSAAPTAGGEGAESYALKGSSGAKIGVNLGKEYPLKNLTPTPGVRILNLSRDFREDPNLKADIHLSDTFCYLGEIRGPLTGQEGADLEIQNDEETKELVYMLYLYGNQNSSGVVRVSCVKLLSEPSHHFFSDLWQRL
jgi:hypothetical protein